MNYQLCLHVWEKFGITEHDMPEEYAKDNCVSNFKVRTIGSTVVIDDMDKSGYLLFSNVHTKEQAEEILQYIKDTEILFV